MTRYTALRLAETALILSIAFAAPVCGAQAAANQTQSDVHADHHEHMHHAHGASADTPVKRSIVEYTMPTVELVRSDGQRVNFADLMQDKKPIYLNFIYTSCTAVCPVMSQIFSGLQKRLGAQSNMVDMISISIDPEYDTPPRLEKYARQYSAGPQWQFYTGSLQSSMAVQKAFDVYNADKMNHKVVTFYREKSDSAWVRLDGFVTPDQLAQTYLDSDARASSSLSAP